MAARQSTMDEVKKLCEAIDWQPGMRIPWEACEEVLPPLKRQDRRFRTIYRAFIRHAQRGLHRKIVTEPGKGLRVLREEERADDVCVTLGRTVTLVQRAKTDVDDIQIAAISRQEDVDRVHHVRTSVHRMDRAMQQEHRRLVQGVPKPGPSEQMPSRAVS